MQPCTTHFLKSRGLWHKRSPQLQVPNVTRSYFLLRIRGGRVIGTGYNATIRQGSPRCEVYKQSMQTVNFGCPQRSWTVMKVNIIVHTTHGVMSDVNLFSCSFSVFSPFHPNVSSLSPVMSNFESGIAILFNFSCIRSDPDYHWTSFQCVLYSCSSHHSSSLHRCHHTKKWHINMVIYDTVEAHI